MYCLNIMVNYVLIDIGIINFAEVINNMQP